MKKLLTFEEVLEFTKEHTRNLLWEMDLVWLLI